MVTSSRLSYSFFWVISRRLNFLCGRFETLSVPHSLVVGTWKCSCLNEKTFSYLNDLWKWECCETLAQKMEDAGKLPNRNIANTAKVWNQVQGWWFAVNFLRLSLTHNKHQILKYNNAVNRNFNHRTKISKPNMYEGRQQSREFVTKIK